MSQVMCQIFFLFFSEKVMELIGVGSVINGATPSSSLVHWALKSDKSDNSDKKNCLYKLCCGLASFASLNELFTFSI